MTALLAPVATPTRRRAPKVLRPFTLAHFRRWASDLILDNGQSWHPEDFQEWFIDDLFAGQPGSWDFSEAWFIVPEGNGKTTLLSGVGLYHCEFTVDGWVPVGAASRDQARILHRQGAGFVRRTERLGRIFRVFDGYRRIKNKENGSLIEVFAADSDTADGVIPTLCLIDEPHRHRDMSLYRTWSGKLEKRGGQLATISTAGEPGREFEVTRARIRQEASETDRKGAFGRFVAGGVVMHEWALPEGGDPDDMVQVKAANPFSGITVKKLAIKRNKPTMTLSHWKRMVCNVPTRADNAAITEAEWEAAKTSEVIPAGARVWVGMDVAWKLDTTAIVPLWWRDDDYRLLGPASIIVPPMDGGMTHPDRPKDALREIHARTPIDTLVMDMSLAADIAAWAKDELGCTVVDRGTSNVFAEQDYGHFMAGLRNAQLKHSGDAGLTRHALNAIARDLPSGGARFDRPVEGRLAAEQERRVIDALMAAAMVHGVAAGVAPEPERVPLVMYGGSRR